MDRVFWGRFLFFAGLILTVISGAFYAVILASGSVSIRADFELLCWLLTSGGIVVGLIGIALASNRRM